MDLSPTDLKKSISHLLHRYHVVVFAVVVLGGLAAAVFVFNNIIAESGDTTNYTSTANNTSFDKATINRINQLKTSDDPADKIDFSKGRTNPFVE